MVKPMIKTLTRFVVLWAMLNMLAACEKAAEPDAAAMALASGAYKSCAACHGAKGEGNQALNAPTLVNLDDWYMKRQLQGFRDGLRGTHAEDVNGQLMASQSSNYAEDVQIDALLSQVADFPDVLPESTFTADLDNGRDNYNMICGACHGPQGVGNEILNAPSLRGLNDWYLAHQYENFRNGIRGTHTDDTYGRQMQSMGQILETEKEARNVAAYLLSLDLRD